MNRKIKKGIVVKYRPPERKIHLIPSKMYARMLTRQSAFLLCANDDEYGCDEVTLDLLQKFRAANVSVEAIFLAKGKHAFNMGDRSSLITVNTWPQRMADWLKDGEFLKK